MSFFQAFEKFSDHIALIDDRGRSLSYSQLADRVDELARRLEGARAIVAVACTNNIESVIAYLAVLKANHVALLLDSELADELKQALFNCFSVSGLIAQDGEVIRLNNVAPVLHQDLALLLSTSGSTGSPKLVKLTQANLFSNASAIADYLGLDASERPLTSLPFHYSYGLSVLNSHLLVGATVLVTGEAVTQREFWNFLHEHHATSFAGVPYTYEMLHRLRFATMSLPSLRYYTQAGGKLRPDLVTYFAEAAQRHQQRFIVMYGQTEATARIAYLPAELALTVTGSIGRVIPGGKLYIQDESGTCVTQSHQTGELVYEGANVMMGYAASAAELALGDQCGGRLATGDLAYFDEQGLFYITGRKKRFIKMLGNRIDLGQVELKLQGLGFECAVVGRDDQLVVVSVYADAQTIKQCLQAIFHFHPSRVTVHRLEVLPHNSSGKIQYGVLESTFLVSE